jgi:hypothetical protein
MVAAGTPSRSTASWYPRVRLEDADVLDGEHHIEEAVEPGGGDGRCKHRRRAVREDRGPQAGRAQPRQHIGHFGKRRQREVEVEQPPTQLRSLEDERLQREIERVRGHLHEIGVAPLCRAQPGVLNLLVAPQRGEAVRRLGGHVHAGAGCGGKVEQRAVGVEHARLDAGQGAL